MSEWRANESVAPWLKRELSRQLGPVAAPESLWDRIEERQCASRPGRSVYWALWPVAAAVMLTAAGSAAWRIGAPHDAARGMQDLALRELKALGDGPGRLDFRSGDPAEIRTWVKTKADIDIDLPLQPSPGGPVQLLGAKLMEQRGAPVVEVAYLAAGGAATLLVGGKRPERDGDVVKTAHAFAPSAVEPGGRVYSWKMREQEYTIASSNTRDPQAACLLCHVQPQMTVN